MLRETDLLPDLSGHPDSTSALRPFATNSSAPQKADRSREGDDQQSVLCSLISLMSQPAARTPEGETTPLMQYSRSLADREWLILQKLEHLGNKASGPLLRAHCDQLARQWTAEVSRQRRQQQAREQRWYRHITMWLGGALKSLRQLSLRQQSLRQQSLRQPSSAKKQLSNLSV